MRNDATCGIISFRLAIGSFLGRLIRLVEDVGIILPIGGNRFCIHGCIIADLARPRTLPCIAAAALLTGPRPEGARRPAAAPFHMGGSFSGNGTRVETSGGIQASLSGRYATALFELARDEKQLDAVTASVATLRDALARSDDFKRLTRSPVVARADAARAIAALVPTMGLDRLTANLLGVMARNGRLFQLGAVIRDIATLTARHRGEMAAEVTSAHALDASQVEALKAKLKGRFGRDVTVALTVDPAILGGLIVKVGSTRIDGSIRTKLNTLAQAMKG